MSGTGWILLIGGGLLAYYLITKSGATYSANPLQNLLPTGGGTPQPCGPGLVWGPIPGIVPSWGCVTPQVAAQRGAE